MDENKPNYIINLTNNELEIITNLAKQITINASQNPNLYCQKSKSLSLQLPNRIKNILKKFRENGSETGFLLIKNIELQNIPSTPSENNKQIGEKHILSKIQSIFINYIGEMISYEAECNGNLFQDVIPMKQMEMVQTSVGSNTELEIHTEQAFSKLRPDLLSLSCLRGDKNAFTYILPVNNIIKNLNKEDIQLLYQPLWTTSVDLSFKLNGFEFIEGDIRGPFSILYGDQANPFLVFDQDLMKGKTEKSIQIIDKIVDIYYHHRIGHNLQPGEIIIIDNNRAVHGRSPFLPKYNGEDRFLIRCFGTFDYEKSKYARPNSSRCISAIYS
jgi:L-asparagine oxygenase